jgi:UDP-N-acetylglucosamine 1-carboxyvinyltransferase
MCSGTLQLSNVPELADTVSMIELMEHLGVQIARTDTQINISGEAKTLEAPYEQVRKMRASILVLGPLLARYGSVKVSLPGGCAIGTRPVDLHIWAMQQLGAIVELADGYIKARCKNGLVGNKIVFPVVSVGATENTMMAASLAKGRTQIINAAREPEIIDLGNCLNAMGAKITGHGTDTIIIEGVDTLSDASHRVIADRIEAGTFAIAAAVTQGDITLRDINPVYLNALFAVLEQTGATIQIGEDWARISSNARATSVDIATQPYPGFPTDLQAQYMCLMATADGSSKITETIFENRFMHVPELMRMSADIQIDGRSCIVHGKPDLKPAPVMATDLRASVCLVLAALATAGTTTVSRIYHLDRGYENLEEKLNNCGARIQRQAE